jgi:hypothetical protein
MKGAVMRKKKTFIRFLVIIALIVFGLVSAQPSVAQTSGANRLSYTPKTFVAFSEFLAGVSSSTYRDFLLQNNGPVAQSQPAFAEMRAYILNMYAGVRQVSSYVMDNQYFDCITIQSQPTMNRLHLTRAEQPPLLSAHSPARTNRPQSAMGSSQMLTGQRDAFGNATSCRPGTIPMERITLERMSKFRTLHDFLAKGSDGTVALANAHRYAAADQRITNYGGNSWLNLWNPAGEFSLSQQWYDGGSGSSLQTVEGGWVHYPAKFGDQSVLFIFYTPNNYASGCYNLDCSGFVQTNNHWALGGKWERYSTSGGDQYGFTMQWKYYQGNWWLYLQGAGNLEAVGYYPGSIYNQGQLSRNAQRIVYGGETYTGGSNWPQMGSGRFASTGWQQAAYQNSIFYNPRDESGGTGVWASLGPIQTNTNCYTINITPASRGGNWGTYFFYGGPGGNC